eukprot:s219_g57.t1
MPKDLAEASYSTHALGQEQQRCLARETLFRAYLWANSCDAGKGKGDKASLCFKAPARVIDTAELSKLRASVYRSFKFMNRANWGAKSLRQQR